MKKLFSDRTEWDLRPNALSLLMHERKKKGLPIFDLTESNPTQCGFEYPQDKIKNELTRDSIFQYEPSAKGLLPAREAISKYYQTKQITADPEDIVLTASTSEAYSFIFKLVTNSGDRILVPQPSYPLFDFLAELNDVELINYPLIYDSKKWHLDFNTLREKVDDKTKAILIVNPNNPTGSFISREELRQLICMAREKNIHLISDEVFHDYRWLQGSHFPSLANISEVMTYTLGGLSKMAGLPQMKLGWIRVYGPQDLKNEALGRLEVIADTYLGVNTPIQHALPKIFDEAPRIQQQIQKRLEVNKQYLEDKIILSSSYELLQSEGGWYAVLKVPRIHTDDEWALLMLEKHGVLLHPGHFYNFKDAGHLVISLLPTPDVFQSGILKLLEE